MKRFIAGAAAAVMLLSGCTQVNEDVEMGSEAVYIAPTVQEKRENYPLSLLSAEERAVYDKLIEAVNAYEKQFVAEGLDDFTAKKLFKLMYTQENRIFWVDSRYSFDSVTGTFDLLYRYDPAQTEEMRAVLDLEVGKILADIPEGSDYDRVKYLHDQLILRSSFSLAGDHSHTSYGAIVDGSAQCEGYAFAMSYLCGRAGLDNYVVTGTSAEGDSHAWNKVYADGEWYNVDCTWDDPILKRESKDYIRHDYLFLSDAEIDNISHFIDNSHFSPLPCTATANNYFAKEGLLCSEADQAAELMEKLIAQAAVQKKCDVEVRFSNGTAYNEFVDALFSKGGLKKIIGKLNGTSGADIASAVKSVNDDLLIVHVSLIYEGEQ